MGLEKSTLRCDHLLGTMAVMSLGCCTFRDGIYTPFIQRGRESNSRNNVIDMAGQFSGNMVAITTNLDLVAFLLMRVFIVLRVKYGFSMFGRNVES